MKVKMKIKRGTPGNQRWQEFDLEMEKTDRVLDGLLEIGAKHDPTLKFRRSCAHGVCGSDAMRINGKEMLACKALFSQFVDANFVEPLVLTIESLNHFPLMEDLVVDQSLFLQKMTAVKPYMRNHSTPEDGREYRQSPEEHAAFEEATKCINCGACYSACPVLDSNPDFLGPAALVQAARFIFDSRNQNKQEQLQLVDHPNGVWSCDNHFECTRACPREIKITKLINQTKRYIKQQKAEA